MVNKCSNPICNTEYRSSHEGQLFPYEVRDPEESCRDVPAVICDKKPGRATVYFWLCEQCCSQFTLQFTMSAGVTLALKYSERDADRTSLSQSSAVREGEGFKRRYA
jgi:hypothetical protein